MSAHKIAIVRLGEAEYRRLREAEEQLRLMEMQQIEQHRREEGSIYDRMLADSREREQRYHGILADLENSLEGVTSQTVNELDALRGETRQALEEHDSAQMQWAQQAAQELDARQAELEQAYQNQFQQLQFDLENHIGQMAQDHIQRLEAQLADQARALQEQGQLDAGEALRTIEAGRNLLDFLSSTYELDPRTANELELLRDELNQAVQFYNQRQYALAFQIAHTACLGLARLRNVLEISFREKNEKYQALVDRAQAVFQRISDQQGVQAMDTEGSELPERIDTSFWTDGAYGQLLEQARQALGVVLNLHAFDLNEIAEWQDEFRILEERGLEMVTQARLAVLASQLRFNVAQIVVQALESQGFYLEDAAYQKNDFRGAFVAHTRSLAGNEVEVRIDPEPALEEGGRLSIVSKDTRLVTEHELRERTREIYQAIQSYGVEVRSEPNASQPAQPGFHQPYTAGYQPRKDQTRKK